MERPKIVEQNQFKTLEDFIHNSNNFYAKMTFNSCSSTLEKDPCYKRFSLVAPELSKELRETMTMENLAENRVLPWEEQLPWEKLWKAYKIMSNLVYIGDPWVKSEKHCNFLTE